ncbi:hypothetical protein SLEP1_g4500 [Rubroshorea leprosula]|uniref:DUF4216 domain-containing protein n=1 Tax=Rubroshorea leprosula TaxID=152421 RepID=A0AAV5HWL2_9ROSI|nr:hypothetical protein SLEP1_g4500 [Rubroshorea leprosula]
MCKLKSTIGNKNHVEASIVEASIVEAFILYEISHFCSRYFGDDVETSWNQHPRNYGGIGTNVPNQGIRVNVEHGIVDVNPRFKLSMTEPFCLAGQAQQVYYTPYSATTDRTTRGWLAACKIKSRHLIETSSTSSSGEVDDIFQDDDPSIMQGSSFAIDLTAYQSLQLCAEGVTELRLMLHLKKRRTMEKKKIQNPQEIVIMLRMMMITLYQWDPTDNRHVRDAFLNCMKHRWSDNIRDEKLKWDKNSTYVPCWIPTHIWPQLLTYWDSNEYKRLSATGAENRSSEERVTHTIGSISFGIHEMRMEKFKETHTFRKKAGKDQEPPWINEKPKYRYVKCTESHGSDASSWPCMDNEAWVKAIGGCSSKVMLGIGSQVNPKMVGFTYKKRQPQENLIAALMASNYEEIQAKDHEELERQRQQIALMQQQLANMTKA